VDTPCGPRTVAVAQHKSDRKPRIEAKHDHRRGTAATARLAWSSPGHWRWRVGLSAIEQAGGLTVVQDPKDAAFPELPENPLQQPGPRSCVYAKCRCFWMHWFVSQPALGSWCRTACGVAGRAWKKMDRLGRRSVLTCSDCGGIMWEIRDGDLSRTENQRSFLAIHGRAWPLTLVAGRGQASGRSDLEGVWLCRIATEQEGGLA
jgi:hypothetical protein